MPDALVDSLFESSVKQASRTRQPWWPSLVVAPQIYSCSMKRVASHILCESPGATVNRSVTNITLPHCRIPALREASATLPPHTSLQDSAPPKKSPWNRAPFLPSPRLQTITTLAWKLPPSSPIDQRRY